MVECAFDLAPSPKSSSRIFRLFGCCFCMPKILIWHMLQPNSEKSDDCNGLVDVLSIKVERKCGGITFDLFSSILFLIGIVDCQMLF